MFLLPPAAAGTPIKPYLNFFFKVVTVKYVNDYSGPKTNTFSQLQNYTKFSFTYEHIIFRVYSVCLVDTIFFFIKCLDLRVTISSVNPTG